MSRECAVRHAESDTTAARLRVTPAATDDWIEIEAMLHDYLEWLRAVTGLEPTVEQPSFGVEIADPRRAYSSDETTMLVARMASRQVGMVAVEMCPDSRDSAGSAELKRLYVRPVARGRRIADLLVAEAIDTARRRGATSIWLETVQGIMDPAVAVYRRHGFEEQRQPSAIPHEGAILMARPIT